MKRFTLILYLLFLFFIQEAFAQNPAYIREKEYEGFSFPREFILQGFPPSPNRYTLKNIDIFQAEEIIHQTPLYFTTNRNPCERKRIRLSKYYRQNVGYIEKNTHILVHIYFIHKAIIKEHELLNDLIIVLDGGNYYWEAIVDITAKKIISIKQNGYG